MPTYLITDKETGKKFKVRGAESPEAARQEYETRFKTKQAAPAPPKTILETITDPFKYGFDQSLEDVADTAEVTGFDGAAQGLRDAADAPKNYTPSNFMNPDGAWYDFNWSDLPKTIAEGSAAMAGSIGAGALGGATVGTLGGGPIGTALGGITGAALLPMLQTFGPTAKERMRRKGTDELSAEDAAAAGLTSLGVGALSAVGARGFNPFKAAKAASKVKAAKNAGRYVAPQTTTARLGDKLGKTVREGSMEAVQDTVQQVGSTALTPGGVEVNPKQTLGAGIAGAATRGAIPDVLLGAPADVALSGVRKRKQRDTLVDFSRVEDPNVIKELESSNVRIADEMKRVIKGGYVDPKDSTKNRYQNAVAGQTMNSVFRRNVNRLHRAFKVLGDDLYKGVDPNTAEGFEYLSILGTIKDNARNKRATILTEDEIKLIQDRVGGTDIGRKLVEVLYDSNTITRLLRKDPVEGLASGIEFMDSLGSGRGLTGAANKIASTAINKSTLGAGQLIYSGARLIDSITGQRYPYKKFVDDWSGGKQLNFSNLPKLSALRAQEALAKVDGERRKKNVYPDSDNLYKEALSNKEMLYWNPEWLNENRAALSPAHFRTLTLLRDSIDAQRRREADRTLAKDEKKLEKQRREDQRKQDRQTQMELRAAEIGIKADQAEEKMRILQQRINDKNTSDAQKAQDRAEMENLKQLREDTIKEFADLMDTGDLSPEIVKQARDSLTASQYTTWLNRANRATAPKATEGVKMRNSMSKQVRDASEQTAKEMAQAAQLMSQAAMKMDKMTSRPITIELPNAPQLSDPSPYGRTFNPTDPEADLVNPAGFYRGKGDIIAKEDEVLQLASALPDGLLKQSMRQTIGLLRNYAKKDQAKRMEVINGMRDVLKSNPDITDAEIDMYNDAIEWHELRFMDKENSVLKKDMNDGWDPLPEEPPF